MSACQWKVPGIKSEIQSLQTLLVARPGLADKKEALVDQLVWKMKHLEGLQAQELVELYETLEQSSLPQTVVQQLVAIVDDLAAGQSHGQASHLVNKLQAIPTLHRYLTEKEFNQILQLNMWNGAVVLAKRMRALGMTSLKESSKKICTVLLVWADWKRTGQPVPPDTIYVLAQHVKTTFDDYPLPAMADGQVTMNVWPDNPMDLPPATLKGAYGDERPCLKDIPELAYLFKSTTIRSSGKNLQLYKSSSRQAKGSTVQSAASLVPLEKPQETLPELERLGAMLASWTSSLEKAQALQQPASSTVLALPAVPQASAGPGPSAGPATVPAFAPPALVPPAQNAGALVHVQEPQEPAPGNAGSKGLEAFEQEHFDVLQGRKNGKPLKKPAAAKAPPKPKSLAKAAAKKKDMKTVPAKKSVGSLKLGCLRCRGAHAGCDQCRNPKFGGLRCDRKEWLKVAEEKGLK